MGAGLINRTGGLWVVESGGYDSIIKSDPVVSQKHVLWKTEYIFAEIWAFRRIP